MESHNPELMYKPRILAITKTDIVESEWENLIKDELPDEIPHVFISSVTGKGIDRLKDLIWEMIN